MFEALIARASRAAEARAEARRRRLAERLEAELPGGIEAEPVEAGVRLAGLGLRRRLALDPALKWLLAGQRR